MRPGQNKRMRGRNRRGPNPLTRSYESNGPDVKVRGTAQHIAEKYTQLARDAHVSGDPVMAESYLQHAEHYYRLIAAAQQAQLAQANGTASDDDDDDDFDTASDRFTFRNVQQQNPQQGQNQPYQGERGPGEGGEAPEGEEQPAGQERAFNDRGNGGRHQNDRRNNRQDRQDRNERFRQGGDRDRNRDRFDPNRPRRPQPDLEGAEQPVLPAFLTAPVRAVPIETPEGAPAPAAEGEGGEEGRSPFRTRRRRRGRGEGGEAPAFETETAGGDQD